MGVLGGGHPADDRVGIDSFKSAETSAGNLNAQEIADATSLAIRVGDSQVSGAATKV